MKGVRIVGWIALPFFLGGVALLMSEPLREAVALRIAQGRLPDAQPGEVWCLRLDPPENPFASVPVIHAKVLELRRGWVQYQVGDDPRGNTLNSTRLSRFYHLYTTCEEQTRRTQP